MEGEGELFAGTYNTRGIKGKMSVMNARMKHTPKDRRSRRLHANDNADYTSTMTIGVPCI